MRQRLPLPGSQGFPSCRLQLGLRLTYLLASRISEGSGKRLSPSIRKTLSKTPLSSRGLVSSHLVVTPDYQEA